MLIFDQDFFFFCYILNTHTCSLVSGEYFRYCSSTKNTKHNVKLGYKIIGEDKIKTMIKLKKKTKIICIEVAEVACIEDYLMSDVK